MTATPRHTVLTDITAERDRQDTAWGEQNHPNGTGSEDDRHSAQHYRQATEEAAANGLLTWRHILQEEVYEALAESDPDRLRAELVQVAAVATAWLEAIDRRLRHS